MAWSNTEADPRTLSGYAFDNTGSGGRTLSGNSWSNDEADPRTLNGAPPQQIEGVDGFESFTYFSTTPPLLDNDVVLSGFDNGLLRVIDNKEWTDNALIGNQRATVKDQSDSKRGLFLPGTEDLTEAYTPAGQIEMFAPLKAEHVGNTAWNTMRIGVLIGYDNTNADSGSQAKFGLGISGNPGANDYSGGNGFALAPRIYFRGSWTSLAYNGGDDRWDTAGGEWAFYIDHSTVKAIKTTSAGTVNMRPFGNAGSSYFPMFFELTRSGTSLNDPGGATNVKMWMGASSSAVGITAEDWATHLGEDYGALSRSGFGYYSNIGTMSFVSDDSNGYEFGDLSHIWFMSQSRGIFLERIGYKILS